MWADVKGSMRYTKITPSFADGTGEAAQHEYL
jgi:hypothetical protein